MRAVRFVVNCAPKPPDMRLNSKSKIQSRSSRERLNVPSLKLASQRPQILRPAIPYGLNDPQNWGHAPYPIVISTWTINPFQGHFGLKVECWFRVSPAGKWSSHSEGP